MKTLTWEELSDEQKREVTLTYISIRAHEEEISEEEVNPSGVKECQFIQDEFFEDVLDVII